MRPRRSKRRLSAVMDAIHSEGQGVYRIGIFSPEGIFKLTERALDGDAYSAGVLVSLSKMAEDLRAMAKTATPLGCLLCGGGFSDEMPGAWVLLHAEGVLARRAVGNGVCFGCLGKYADGDALMGAVADFYRSNLMADLRMIQPVSGVGHG